MSATQGITVANPAILQVTKSVGNIFGGFNFMPSVATANVGSEQRTYVAFASDRDLDRVNPNTPGFNADGSFEIFLAQTEPKLNFRITQIVTTTGLSASILPTLSEQRPDGTLRIAYLSDVGPAQLPGAQNPDRSSEVFVSTVDPNGAVPKTLGTVQVSVSGPTVLNDTPVIAGNGDRVVFVSNASNDPTLNTYGADNPEGNQEIFLAFLDEAGGRQIIQVTKTPTDTINSQPAISADGTRIVFVSNSKTLPDNADGNEDVFMATVAADRSVTFRNLSDSHIQRPMAPMSSQTAILRSAPTARASFLPATAASKAVLTHAPASMPPSST